jgi:hypothetical protein
MFRRIAALVAVLALGVCGVALAAKPKVKHVKTSGTINANNVPGKPLAAGIINDKRIQGGAIVFQVAVGSGEPGLTHVVSKHVAIYTTKGSLEGSAKVDLELVTGGDGIFKNGTFTFNKGTGAYKGWKFKGTFSGSQKEDGYRFKYKGTFTRPAKK